jgi:hypothetical protein
MGCVPTVETCTEREELIVRTASVQRMLWILSVDNGTEELRACIAVEVGRPECLLCDLPSRLKVESGCSLEGDEDSGLTGMIAKSTTACPASRDGAVKTTYIDGSCLWVIRSANIVGVSAAQLTRRTTHCPEHRNEPSRT